MDREPLLSESKKPTPVALRAENGVEEDGEGGLVVTTPNLRHRLYADVPDDEVERIPLKTVFGYSMGHVQNDMAASVWFSVLLLYLRMAVRLDPTNAGIVLFSGQISDGIATPLVGVGSDNSVCCPRYGLGRRKGWNLSGAVLVSLCFSLIYMVCLRCAADVSPPLETLYYAVMASLFNVGWAAVQVSHMSLVPELASHATGQTLLNSARYAMTVIANVSVFCGLWGLLHWLPGASTSEPDVYRYLAGGVIALGFCATLLFLILTPDPSTRWTGERTVSGTHSVSANTEDHPAFSVPEDEAVAYIPAGSSAGLSLQQTPGDVDDDYEPADGRGGGKDEEETLLYQGGDSEPKQHDRRLGAHAGGVASKSQRMMRWTTWFRRQDLYIVGANYMMTRLVVNISQVYLPFFVTVTLRLNDTAVAIAPLIVYVASLIATSVVRPLTKRIGRSLTYSIGSLLCASACVGFLLIPQGDSATPLVYFCAGILGLGNATIMVTSVSLEAEMVGKNTETGAFVYGILSLTDKLSNGAAILTIQILDESLCPESSGSEHFFRAVIGWIPLISAILGALFAALTPHVAGKMFKETKTTSS